MDVRRIAILICLAAACRLAASPAASAAPNPAATAAARATTLAARSSPAPSATGCDKQLTFGEVTLCSDEFNFNFKTGDVQFPRPLHGRTSDGSYRADRGYGNLHSQIMNLIGHVVVHRDSSHDKAGKPIEAMTLTADQVHIESKAKFYRASGNVKVVQGAMTMTAPLVVDDEAHRTMTASGGVKIVRGDQTMSAPQIALDESTHVAHMTGGVHAAQPPDRSFDAAEVFYNTQTQDFKAVGSVRMRFPANQPTPAGAKPTPTPKPGARPSVTAKPAGASAATASPLPTAAPSAQPQPTAAAAATGTP